jgi:toxin ParE1/3/4
MRKFKFSNEAVKDLEEIWIYTKQIWSIEQADRYYNLIIDEVEFISQNPSLCRDITYIKDGYRSTKVKSHVIYYKIDEDGVILIVRILHQRMDVETRMK